MATSAPQTKTTKSSVHQAKQTTLQRTLTSTINDLGVENALLAVYEREDGPLRLQLSKGFTTREAQAILRSVSVQDLGLVETSSSGEEREKALRLRLIMPSAKSLVAVPLCYRQRPYGVFVIGRKEGTSFSKKEKGVIESASEDVTTALERASLFDGSVLMTRPWVLEEPRPASVVGEAMATPPSLATPDMQVAVQTVLNETADVMAYDRAWVTSYDPIGAVVEVLGLAGETKGDPKKALKQGQRLGLDESASGWVVRHRKPRIDHDLASTQGRFFDHKPLFKDRFLSAMVLPFFVRGQIGGTITLASKADGRYSLPDARSLEPILLKLAELVQRPDLTSSAPPLGDGSAGSSTTAPVPVSAEPFIRKQERQAALGEFSAFLAAEVREPLASIRAQLEDITGEGIMDFDPQVRVESAMRDLIRVEAILNEILDFAKPLELKRRLCRAAEIIDHALTLIATDLERSRITVSKQYPDNLAQVRCDDGKMQLVFLSIFTNALEAMTPGGHLEIQLSMHRAGRNQEVEILIKNDGAPIPPELVGEVFEPYFTTKRSGTGLGLATVKKIVEEHHGRISIASSPDQGTSVTIFLPAAGRPGSHRHPGSRRYRGRRPPRPRR